MDLTWLGHGCIRMRGRETTILCDPCSKDTGYNIGRQAADIVTLSHDHPAHSNVAVVSGHPKVIAGPGEYEVGGALIIGVRTYHDAQSGALRGKNTAYLIEIDGTRVCHLGDIGHLPSEQQIEQLVGADILVVPVGGGTTIDAQVAARTVSLLEPRIVVPVHYATPASRVEGLDGVERFLKEMGVTDVTPESKISTGRGGVSGETRTVVLEYRA
ncbi:MAG TPA: MBL fold metallo-hydrolase [Dehalococcoidia bacterium]|nr:MBL fold metallo-hydrolase [Dehalococcoidia bacterium]